MKKIFFLTFLLPVTAFVYQSCQPVDNSKEILKSDSIAGARLVMFRDSLKMACMADVMTAAKLRADSLMAFAMHKKGAKAPTKPKAPAPPSNPKTDKMNNAQQNATEEKKAKMEGAQENSTEKKKAKMKGVVGDTTKPKL